MAIKDHDQHASERKKDHIDLAFKSRVEAGTLDDRFYYEPLFAAHPKDGDIPVTPWGGKTLRVPMWVSSMTGGTAKANIINKNLARACAEFGMGMGLGSCRQLLFSDEYLPDFDVRGIMGDDLPLYANLGIAQIERLLKARETDRIAIMLEKLRADGLIIHVNPLQEAMQPEGDVFEQSPLETISQLLDHAAYPVIVKEVGQGFGPASLEKLMQLPLEAIEFAAAGGTNFAKLELLRDTPEKHTIFAPLTVMGHTALEMVTWVNEIYQKSGKSSHVKRVIISGGLNDFTDGYHLIQKSEIPAVFGLASAFLRHAQGSYDDLQAFTALQVRGLALAYSYLRVR